MTDLNKTNGEANRMGTIAVALSGTSMLVYFFSSYAVRNYFGFLADTVNKTLEILFK